MLEEQLRLNMILNRTGAFSIKKSSRSMVESLRYCGELLQKSDNMVLIFPQGEIQTMHSRYLVFEAGLASILKQSPIDIDLIFNVNLIDYFSRSKPSLTIYYKHYALQLPADIREIERDYNDYLCQCIDQQKER